MQIQQRKKISKWRCKICHEHQSLQRVYFESEQARECRQALHTISDSIQRKAEITEKAILDAVRDDPNDSDSNIIMPHSHSSSPAFQRDYSSNATSFGDRAACSMETPPIPVKPGHRRPVFSTIGRHTPRPFSIAGRTKPTLMTSEHIHVDDRSSQALRPLQPVVDWSKFLDDEGSDH
ncbi:hypothetical protein BASA50_009854 [Batrachochytrium salamandrivorans]|uniref:MRN complex-interacting protein N-terminal domain-containing protein n=1 Tax=Batrachochytrium salamandrivorans TaxID=1357716 RepID=A0ABQ8F077_9FUNG|nr:hypothetical protein BASA62_006479 [Batrachochytrium salamandrivorans]KAH6568709.1 hypothetical protein BASA60_008514 [Batrachochytrium salamandrivorans]KAH6584729.1 hypothetical protein BASA61_007298 [Batrachochytrium salamandrivorans]KAH6589762.1 hypothetical protein BASA50_009854 [Batrachochytrium salamandrivorans]